MPLRNIVSSKEANTASCVFSRSLAITIDPQSVTSKVDVVDKTNLNVGARDSIPKLRVLSNQYEALSPSRPNVSAQGLTLGPLPLDNVVNVNAQGLPLGLLSLDNVSTSIVKSNAMAMEKIKGLRIAICEGITRSGTSLLSTILLRRYL